MPAVCDDAAFRGRRAMRCLLPLVTLVLLSARYAPAADEAKRAKAEGDKPEAAAGVTTHNDLVYSKVGDTELKLDLAVPAEGEGPFPVIVFIHGGGWAGGNRVAHRPHIQQAAERGYVSATVSYRLMQYDRENKETATAEQAFPAQVHDVKAAIRWLRANAREYNADPERIGVVGFSAGGHLVLMLGLTDEKSGLEGDGGNPDVSSRVQAVVNVFGPTEMKTAWQASSVAWIFRLFMGGTPDEAAENYRLASPVTWASKDDPPVLTVHGDQDKLVPVSNARLLDEKMKEAGASHRLLVLEGQGHGFRGEALETMIREMWAFFEKHLKQPAAATAQ